MPVPTAAVEQAVLGGCTIVQLREDHISSRDFYDTAKEIKEITDTYDILLIINNRIDIALAVDAAGVHIGQSDIPASAARIVSMEEWQAIRQAVTIPIVVIGGIGKENAAALKRERIL